MEKTKTVVPFDRGGSRRDPTLKKAPPAHRRRKATRKGRRQPYAWCPGFLAALEQTCNITLACRAAEVHRSTAYDHRNADPEFKALWDAAEETGVELLEAEARRRAVGTQEKNGSDLLMIFLLKAHRPEKYRDNATVRHTGVVGVKFIPDMRVSDDLADGDDSDAS
jgi:hypothetical protein